MSGRTSSISSPAFMSSWASRIRHSTSWSLCLDPVQTLRPVAQDRPYLRPPAGTAFQAAGAPGRDSGPSRRLQAPSCAPALFHLSSSVRRGDVTESRKLLQAFARKRPDSTELGPIGLMLGCIPAASWTRSRWRFAVLQNSAHTAPLPPARDGGHHDLVVPAARTVL